MKYLKKSTSSGKKKILIHDRPRNRLNFEKSIVTSLNGPFPVNVALLSTPKADVPIASVV